LPLFARSPDAGYLFHAFLMGCLVMAIQAGPLDHWHQRSPIAQGDRLVHVAFGQGTFVAVGEAGEIQTTMDGANWTRCNSGTIAALAGITATGNLFVVAGEMGTIIASTDGRSWVRRESAITDGIRGSLNALASG
jgi:hypothetical protein